MQHCSILKSNNELFNEVTCCTFHFSAHYSRQLEGQLKQLWKTWIVRAVPCCCIKLDSFIAKSPALEVIWAVTCASRLRRVNVTTLAMFQTDNLSFLSRLHLFMYRKPATRPFVLVYNRLKCAMKCVHSTSCSC